MVGICMDPCAYGAQLIRALLCDLACLDFGLEKLEDIDGSLIVEATSGVVEFGESG